MVLLSMELLLWVMVFKLVTLKKLRLEWRTCTFHIFQLELCPKFVFNLALLTFKNPPLKLDTLDVPEVLENIRNEKIFDTLENEGFQKTLKKIIDNPDYMNTVAKYDLDIPDDADMNTVLWAFILSITKLFAFTGARDFFLLHGVTSCWSLMSTYTQIRDHKLIFASLRSYWRALVLTYIVQGRKKFVPLTEQEMEKELQGSFTDWNTFFEKTRDRTNDEHYLKVVYMVKEFEDEWQKGALSGQPKDTHLFKYAASKCAEEFFGHNEHWIFS